MLIDTSKCMGCRGCQAACKQWNQLPAENTTFDGSYENPPRYSAQTWMRVAFNEYEDENGRLQWRLAKEGCMHCGDAACMKVCPSGAIEYTDYGTVHVDDNKCIGCNYCIRACPFDVMGFDRERSVARKCTFCYDRLVNGYEPSCATVCPTGAIVSGERGELLTLAYDRMDQLKGDPRAPNPQVYGDDEVGGTGVVYVLGDDPEKYHLPADPQVPWYAGFWNSLFRPLRVLVVIAIGFGLWTNHARSKKIQNKKKKA